MLIKGSSLVNRHIGLAQALERLPGPRITDDAFAVTFTSPALANQGPAAVSSFRLLGSRTSKKTKASPFVSWSRRVLLSPYSCFVYLEIFLIYILLQRRSLFFVQQAPKWVSWE